jgi:hypothetical protein
MTTPLPVVPTTPEQCDEVLAVLQDLMQHPGIPIVLAAMSRYQQGVHQALMHCQRDDVDHHRGAYTACGDLMNFLVPTQEQVAQGDYLSLTMQDYLAHKEALLEARSQSQQTGQGVS